MLSKINFSIFLFIILIFSSWAQNEQNPGFLSVTGADNLAIYLDTTYIAGQSFANFELPAGRYTLYGYDPNDLNWQQRGFKRQIEISEGEHLLINLAHDSVIRLESKPFGSEVYSNNKLLGRTPIILKSPVLNSNTFTLKKQGYQDYTFSLNKSQNNYLIKLTRKIDFDPSVVLKEVPNKKHFSWLREGLVVTSLVGSWASFFFKREADKHYDRYLHTANPAEMNRSFKKTEDFDRYAEIAIGVSVISLGTYLYLLITD